MNNKLSIAIALLAGLLGGMLARYVAPPTAFAQNPTPVPKEIRAQSFTLVDPANRVVGTFTSDLGAPTPPAGVAPTPPTPKPNSGSAFRPRTLGTAYSAAGFQWARDMERGRCTENCASGTAMSFNPS